MFASTLNHEIIRRDFYACNRTDGNEDYVEPFLAADSPEADPELRVAVEHRLWGIYMNATMHSLSGARFGCWPVTYGLKGKTVVTSHSHVILPVYTCWVLDFFSERVWGTLDSGMIDVQVRAVNVRSSS
jgi:hypothetical protein